MGLQSAWACWHYFAVTGTLADVIFANGLDSSAR
jgi:hypothetical protein